MERFRSQTGQSALGTTLFEVVACTFYQEILSGCFDWWFEVLKTWFLLTYQPPIQTTNWGVADLS